MQTEYFISKSSFSSYGVPEYQDRLGQTWWCVCRGPDPLVPDDAISGILRPQPTIITIQISATNNLRGCAKSTAPPETGGIISVPKVTGCQLGLGTTSWATISIDGGEQGDQSDEDCSEGWKLRDYYILYKLKHQNHLFLPFIVGVLIGTDNPKRTSFQYL